MGTSLTLIVFAIAYTLMFVIHGAMLFGAMYLAGIPATWRGFFGLNFLMTFPYMVLPTIPAILVAGVLFWCFVFKLTAADGFLQVFGMVICLNLIGLFTIYSVASSAISYAQQHRNDPSSGSSDFAKEFERGFWEGYNWSTGNTPKKEQQAGEQPVDTSGLTIAVSSSAGEPVAILSGTIRNRGSRVLNGAVISYDFKKGDLSGFGTITVGPLGPNGTTEINRSLDGAILPAAANQNDFVKITAAS